MRKIFFILVAVIFLAVAIWFLATSFQQPDLNISPPLSSEEDVAVYIAGNLLNKNQITFIAGNTLNPEFTIRYPVDQKVRDVIFDEKINALSQTPILDGIDIQDNRGELQITLPFLLDPKTHSIFVVTANEEGIEETYSYKFSLGIKNTFDDSLASSEFFLTPDGTPRNTWRVENGKLIASPPEEGHASIAFLYRFTDVSASFELVPRGNVINLVFYFLESGRSIVIGNGNNSTITLIQGPPRPDKSINKNGFHMEAGKKYSVFIFRKDNEYKVYTFEGEIGENSKKIVGTTPSLEFVDATHATGQEDPLGFAIWSGSSSFELDNLTVYSDDYIEQ